MSETLDIERCKECRECESDDNIKHRCLHPEGHETSRFGPVAGLIAACDHQYNHCIWCDGPKKTLEQRKVEALEKIAYILEQRLHS